jgi:hypothetical protein
MNIYMQLSNIIHTTTVSKNKNEIYISPRSSFRIIVFSALQETACISFILQTFQEKLSKYKIVCFVLFILISISYF